jgi:hypothetical protein
MKPKSILFAVCVGSLAVPMLAQAQATGTPRNYVTPYTRTAPTIDGVATAGEWDAAPAATGWHILRRPEEDIDGEKTRFRMMWDEKFLYLLVQSDKASWSPANDSSAVPHVPGQQIQGISFGADNLNIYIDPNLDGEINERPDGQVDGYQIAWNQLTGKGELVDDGAGGRVFTNTGLFLENHVNSPFGNQGRWQGLRASTFVQNHGASGGTVELALAWADLDAPNRANFLADPRAFPGDDGSAQLQRPRPGDKWIFNLGRISSDPENFLPIWSWHSAQSFAVAPHGTIEFAGGPRSYTAEYTATPPTIDGAIVGDEWDGVPFAGDWNILRRPVTDVDAEKTRFKVKWDKDFVYFLVVSDKKSWSPANDASAVPNTPGQQNQGISFGADNLNIYIDPNLDKEQTARPDGEVDGYQIAWNQLEGKGEFVDDGAGGRVYTNTGLFLEDHINTPFGNNGRWQGLRLSSFVQNHTASGGVIEFALSWRDLDAPNAAQFEGDPENFPADAGTALKKHPLAGDEWIFNISRIGSDSANFLPIWSWHGAQSFAVAPHGFLKFAGGPRTYAAQYTPLPPTIDGKVDPGEWNYASGGGAQWNILRRPQTDVDAENSRFKVLWDSTYIYFLVESDKTSWSPATDNSVEHVPGQQVQGIAFGADNLNIYLDPNIDGEPNFRPDGEVDGYQIAWNQLTGEGSLEDNGSGGRVFKNTGLFLENHLNTPFGNQGNWQGLRKSLFKQVHGDTGGVIEFALAWADIDAPKAADFPGDLPADTGTAHAFPAVNGERWIFNISRISSDSSNFLPIWSWHGAQSFAVAPHGDLLFVGGAAGPAKVKITGVSSSAAGLKFSFASVNGSTYDVEYAQTLGGTWSSIATGIAGTGAVVDYTDSNATRLARPVGLYRVVTR